MKIDGIKLSTLNKLSLLLYAPFILTSLVYYLQVIDRFESFYFVATFGDLIAPFGFFLSSVVTINIYNNRNATKTERIITYFLAFFGLVSTLYILWNWLWLRALWFIFGFH